MVQILLYGKKMRDVRLFRYLEESIRSNAWKMKEGNFKCGRR